LIVLISLGEIDVENQKIKVLIDTDPGIGTSGADIDDGVTILLALASPEIEVVGLTTVAGNVPCDIGSKNAVELMRQIGQSRISVAQGCSVPMGRRSELLIEREKGREFGPLDPKYRTLLHPLHGVDFLIETVQQSKESLTIVAIGPLTNLGMALTKEPSIAGKIKEIVMMGGGVNGGNVTAAAEFNLLNDPEAADVVFRSGVPLTMIGLDITTSIRIYEPDLALWRDASPVVKSLYNNAIRWMNYRWKVRGENNAGCYFHDAMTVAYLIDRSLFESKACHVDIELVGSFTRGMTVVDRRPNSRQFPNVNLITRIDGRQFVRMTTERIGSTFG
jgi:purine nucleosidase